MIQRILIFAMLYIYIYIYIQSTIFCVNLSISNNNSFFNNIKLTEKSSQKLEGVYYLKFRFLFNSRTFFSSASIPNYYYFFVIRMEYELK